MNSSVLFDGKKSIPLSTSCLNISHLRQTAGVNVSDAVCAERLLELKAAGWNDLMVTPSIEFLLQVLPVTV